MILVWSYLDKLFFVIIQREETKIFCDIGTIYRILGIGYSIGYRLYRDIRFSEYRCSVVVACVFFYCFFPHEGVANLNFRKSEMSQTWNSEIGYKLVRIMLQKLFKNFGNWKSEGKNVASRISDREYSWIIFLSVNMPVFLLQFRVLIHILGICFNTHIHV